MPWLWGEKFVKNVEQTGTFEEEYFVVNIGLKFLIDDLCKIYSVCAVKYIHKVF